MCVCVCAGVCVQVVALEALAGDLDNGGLRPLAQLDNPNPADFPRPAKGSERWVRAFVCVFSRARRCVGAYT